MEIMREANGVGGERIVERNLSYRLEILHHCLCAHPHVDRGKYASGASRGQ
jgi:hypothetical protein